MLTKEIEQKLQARTPVDEIKWKPTATKKKDGSFYTDRDGNRVAMCTAHVDARYVMQVLDEVVGSANWSDSYRPSAIAGGVECTLTIYGVSKSDVGLPSQTDPVKGAYSDALKRAAVKFGIGRDLYSMGAEYLPFNGYKITSKPQPQQQRQQATPRPQPQTAQPRNETAIFVNYVISNIKRYSHKKAVMGALIKLGYTGVSDQRAERKEQYERIKAYAELRDSGVDSDSAVDMVVNGTQPAQQAMFAAGGNGYQTQ